MSAWEEVPLLPEDLCDPVRLFPLPNLVMFPHVGQPLHVFEPRYCRLVREALVGDRLVATALLAPGWEHDYEGRPPIKPVVCINRILTHSRDEEGRFNILLLGQGRAEVTHELPPDRPFRQAEVLLMPDEYPLAGDEQRSALQRDLLAGFRSAIPDLPQAQQQFDQLLGYPIPLGMLTDIAAFSLNLELAARQRLLSEPDVDRRARCLLDHLEQEGSLVGPSCEFPPPFSLN